MNKTVVLVFFAILFYGCSSNRKTSREFNSDTIKIKQLSENLYVHISYLETDDFGKVACNGMVYSNKDEAVVFDTPTNNRASEELIGWLVKKQKKRIKAVVATHFHNDCLGGLQAFHNHGIRSYAGNRTMELVTQKKLQPAPQEGFETQMELPLSGEVVLVKFFGEGHTKDNVVGYVPKDKVLFGGCLVKSTNAGKGYLGDANTAQWSETVKKIKRDFPDLKFVIPGHGASGGAELLDYTIELFDN